MHTRKSQPCGRKHQRAKVDLYINKIVGDEPYLSRVRDISAGGIYLYRLIEPDVDPVTVVGLELKLPHRDEVLWATARVVRREQDADLEGVALTFVRIADHDRRLINTYVEQLRGAEVPRRIFA